MPWRELANDYSIVNALEKKAPSGFGLGENTGKYITSLAALDAIDKNGIYFYYNPNEAIGSYPYGQNGAVLHIRDDRCHTQFFFPGGTDTRYWRRTRYEFSETWGAWEFVKVPMDLNVEYRTTERYMGYPVYVKLINLGAIPSAGDTKQISVSDLGIRVPISMDLTWGNAASENFVINNYTPYLASAGFDNANINIVGGPNADTAHYTVYALLKYSKGT